MARGQGRGQPPADLAPPRLADPRRWGSLVGLAGAVVFVWSSSPALATVPAAAARVLVVLLVAGALALLFVVPRWLGRFHVPSAAAMTVYVLCVLGELALIRAGTATLEARGDGDAAPALVAAVVGLHFLPFAWAFRERMFTVLGSALLVLGLAGLVASLVGVGVAADAAAVLAGLTMAGLVAAYAAGAFASTRPRPGPSSSPSARRAAEGTGP